MVVQRLLMLLVFHLELEREINSTNPEAHLANHLSIYQDS